MLPNDDLARWGEPPTDARELALAELLAELTACDLRGAPRLRSALDRLREQCSANDLLETSTWLTQTVHAVLERSGVFENLPPPAGPGEGPGTVAVELRLNVSRILPGGLLQSVASTQRAPTVLRDLRRVPEDPDRVTLRSGERVRIDAVCDRAGYLAVVNVGPSGNLHLLHPEPGQPAPALRPREAVRILEVELVPPAGRERVYAIWTRQAATVPQLAAIIRPGAVLRDMVRVQDELEGLPAADWHAVMLELEHHG